MVGHGRVGPLDVPFRIRRAQARQLLERAAPRNVAVELVVGRGLVGDEIGQDVAREQPLEQITAFASTPIETACRASFAARARSMARSMLVSFSSR